MRDLVKLTRNDLYDKVWAVPLTKLSKEFNLSDNGLRKICRNFDIPLPPVGYWQKLQFGRKVAKPPLPKQENEKEIKILIDKNKNASNPTDFLKKMLLKRLKVIQH